MSDLQKSPLALRLSLVLNGDVMTLALIALSGVSALLNNGTHVHDPDDAVLVSKIPAITTEGAVVLIYPSGTSTAAVDRDENLQKFYSQFMRDHVPLACSPGHAPRIGQVRDEFQLLLESFPVLWRGPASNASRRASSEEMDTTGPTPSTSSESSSRGGTIPPVLDPSKPGNKYDHVIPDHWVISDTPYMFRKIFSAGICKSTADQYGPYVSNWFQHCSSAKINPTSPSIHDLMAYLSLRAAQISASSISTNLAAIKFFLKVNLAPQDIFSHPSLSTFLKGLANFPRVSNSSRKIRLTMNKEALKLTGHVIQSHHEWPSIDRTTTWALVLVCFYGCSRAGDLLSSTANKATPKTITWETISSLPDGKMLIYIPSPKTSVGNKGLPMVLSTNPDTRFCPVHHLSKVRSFYGNSGPVFRYFSGKLLTPSAVNKILKETSELAGVPDNAQYSCHSLRAAMPTFMAQNPSNFSYNKLLAAGRWCSKAAHAYVRCGLRASDRLSKKVYNLN